MNYEQRKELVERIDAMPREERPTWRGRPVTLGGTKIEHSASIITSAPGCYAVSWQDVAAVMAGEKTFDQCFIWKTSDAWLGCE